MPSFVTHLICSRCDRRHEAREPQNLCSCGGPLLVEYDLEAGQSLLIHPGHLAMYRAEMTLEFATVKGVKNKFFGDSLMMAEIHGPGHVWLQSLTMAKLAEALEPYLPDRSTGGDNN